MKNISLNKEETITVATSISPKDIENQRNAINTWIELGFHVVSLNCIEEYEKLKPYFPDIEFVVVKRDARNEYGKPYVYFDDFMEFFRNCDSKICGIINSDIYLFVESHIFKNYIYKQAEKSIIFGSRMDVKSLDSLIGTMLNNGFDYFFFDREISFLYPKEEFCIGQPVWDYWIILIPILNKVRIKKIINPIAYHIKHPLNWSSETGAKFLKRILKNHGDKLSEFQNEIKWHKHFINLLKIINDHCEEIVLHNNNDKQRILVVYDNCGVNIEKSITYKSILEQTYNNFRIIIDKRENIDATQFDEELIYFIREGCILNKYFLTFMNDIIKKNDYAVCGIKLIDNNNGLNQSIYPVNLSTMNFKINEIIEECIIYRTKFLQRVNKDFNNLMNGTLSFVGDTLVQLSNIEYISRRLNKIKSSKIYIYGAGGHTKDLFNKIDFSQFNICGILDSNKNLEGFGVNNYPIYHFSKINELQIDYILISSLSYEKEIYNQLKESFQEDKLIRIYFI
ncbi:nucleoside-diphosphate sugar epimerase/dehydratase [Clostridium sp. BSD9I1]|uniref:nucleoside-diphosphate sugar epimerase/dehydratase n=1 Tax=Clostridium sp. BSD9I1 TaxID=2003589 RepID=UPI0016470B03|nr:hypothetical protein [Clostridium sp. BSD9I1]